MSLICILSLFTIYINCNDLIKAVNSGDFQKVESLIKQNVNVNEKNTIGDTALLAAVFKGNKKIVALLVKSGSDVNIINNYGDSALHIAALWGFVDIVNMLISNGANVNKQNRNGDTPLHHAVKNIEYQIQNDLVILLIKFGSNLRIKNNDGKEVSNIVIYKEISDLICCVKSVENNINEYEKQAKEIKEILLERWINQKCFFRLNLIKHSLENFYQSWINTYLKLITGQINPSDMKNILICNSVISQQVKKDQDDTILNKIFKYFGLSSCHNNFIKKKIYKSLRGDLYNIYLLSLNRSIPIEVASKIALEY